MVIYKDITTNKIKISYKNKYNSESVNKQEKVMYNVLQTELLTVNVYIHNRAGFPVIILKQIHLCLRAKGLIDIVTPLQKAKI